MKTKILLITTMFTVLGLLASSAMAGNKLFTSRIVEEIFFTNATSFLPLDDVGSTIRTFNGIKNKKYMIFFAAECSVMAAGTFKWVDLTIEVKSPKGDWESVEPTNDPDYAFCSSHDDNFSLSQWVSAATHGVYRPTKSGVQQIRVSVRLDGWSTGDAFRIDDLSLMVVK